MLLSIKQYSIELMMCYKLLARVLFPIMYLKSIRFSSDCICTKSLSRVLRTTSWLNTLRNVFHILYIYTAGFIMGCAGF